MSIVVKVLSPDFVSLKTLIDAAAACGLVYDPAARDFYTDRKLLPCTGKFYLPLTEGETLRHRTYGRHNDEIGLTRESDGTWSLTWDCLNMDGRLLPLVGEDLAKLKQEYQVARAQEYCGQRGLVLERCNNADGTVDLYYNE